MNQKYKKQVALLLAALPEVAKEDCFALYGGTAINLFLRDMPRLSVDIDLLYLPIEDRATSLAKIAEALERIKKSIQTVVPDANIRHDKDKGKLFITKDGADIKIEVSTTGRGTIAPPVKMTLCDKAQKDFDAFAVMQVVDKGQLFGGKICAALDRQHPRDLFDVKYLLENEGFTEDIKTGFLYSLIGSDRPYHEIIRPNMLDQRETMRTKFDGMSEELFSYEDFEATREKLLKTIHASLTDKDRAFVLGVKNLTPDWSVYDFERFPAVRWKLKHLQTLKDTDPVFPGSYIKLFNNLLDRNQLKYDRDNQPRTAYSLRHTYICLRLMEGADVSFTGFLSCSNNPKCRAMFLSGDADFLNSKG